MGKVKRWILKGITNFGKATTDYIANDNVRKKATNAIYAGLKAAADSYMPIYYTLTGPTAKKLGTIARRTTRKSAIFGYDIAKALAKGGKESLEQSGSGRMTNFGSIFRKIKRRKSRGKRRKIHPKKPTYSRPQTVRLVDLTQQQGGRATTRSRRTRRRFRVSSSPIFH